SDTKIVDQGNVLTMMIPPSFQSYVAPFVDKLMACDVQKLGLLGTTSEYGQEWTPLAPAVMRQKGCNEHDDNSVDYSTVSDFAGPVSRTLADQPDVIFIGGPSQPNALIVEEARKQGYDGSFLVMDQAKFEEMQEFTDPKNLNDAIGVKPARDY